MKKIVSAIVVCTLVFSLAGCGKNGTESKENSAVANENTVKKETEGRGEAVSEVATKTGADGSEPPESERMAGQDAAGPDGSEPDESGTESVEAGGGNGLVVYFSWSGNTENVAKAIAGQTGADVFEIVPEEAYVDDYDALLDIAMEEKESGARPAIAGSIEDIAQYDVVYVGYPNWWSDMPMILYTFFDSYDLSGKTVVPFCTSGGSGFSGTVNRIRELEPDAEVLEGLHIGSSSASDPENAVRDWLGSLAY